MRKLRLNDELHGKTGIWTVVCWLKSLSPTPLFSSEVIGKVLRGGVVRGVLGEGEEQCLHLQILVWWGSRVAVLRLEYASPSQGLRHPWSCRQLAPCVCSFLGTSSKESVWFKKKNQLRKQTIDWRRVLVTRVWPHTGKDLTIKYHPYHPVERDVVLLLKHLWEVGERERQTPSLDI